MKAISLSESSSFVPFRVVVLWATILAGSSSRSASATPFFLPDHPYVKAVDYSSSRSPCPALNTLANHGYINRDGQNISVTDIGLASEEVFGIERSAVRLTTERALGAISATPGIASDGKTSTLNLADLYEHNKVEHDASLVRRDEYFGGPFAQFDEELFQGLIAHATDGNLTLASTVRYATDRIKESRKSNPEASFHHDGSVLQEIADEMIFLMFFGNDPYLDAVPVDWLRNFLQDNKIPDTFLTREERGLPVVNLLKDSSILSRVRPIVQQISSAASLPLVSNTDILEETPVISSTKVTPLAVIMEDLRLFMKDFGNGDVVTVVPDRPLERFFEQIGSGILPLVPQYYAGTNGAATPFIKDKGIRYPLLLRPIEREPEKQQLPDLDQVFDRLFLRKKFIPETRVSANMLLVSFANWFLDEIFRTEPNTDGSLHRFPSPSAGQCEASGGITLKTIYGTDSSREKALRTFKNGMMKTGPNGGLPSLPQIRLDHPDFVMVCGWNRADTSCYDDETFKATGHERFNFHPGHLVYTELFLREHNLLAETLQEQNPSWDDQLIYQTARLILSHILAKIILNEYISNAVSTAQDNVELGYDPDRWRQTNYDKMQMHVSLEFNHVYRWHGLVAEELDFAEGDLEAFSNMLWKPSMYEERGAPSLARALHRTRMGALEAHNTPAYLRAITKQTIADERAQSMQGYNAYREYFTLPKLESFEDLQAGPDATEALKEMYESVDDIELFVGAMVEQRFVPGTTFMSELLLVSIANQAFSGVLNTAVIKDPNLYSERSLTKFGLEYIQGATLKSMLERHFGLELPCGTPLLLEGDAACNSIERPTGWTLKNFIDMVGLDFVLDPFFDESFFFEIFKVFVALVLCVFGAFLLVHQFMSSRYEFYRNLVIYDQFRFCYGVVNVAELVVTAGPYSYYASLLLFGPDFVDVAETHYRVLFAFMLAHGVLYIIETCARLVYTKAGMLLYFHHFMWFLLILAAALSKSVFLFKVDFLLDVMVSFEAGLFVALLCRRHSDNLKLRIRTIVWGNWIFFITRILQTFLLLYLLIQSGPRMTSSGAGDIAIYAFAWFAAIVLSALQFYSMAIYYRFYIQDSAKLEASSTEETSDESGAKMGVKEGASSDASRENVEMEESKDILLELQDKNVVAEDMGYDIDHRTGKRVSSSRRASDRRRSSIFSADSVRQARMSIRASVLSFTEGMEDLVDP